TRSTRDWSSDVCSSDLGANAAGADDGHRGDARDGPRGARDRCRLRHPTTAGHRRRGRPAVHARADAACDARALRARRGTTSGPRRDPMNGRVKILFVIVKETDTWNDGPLYAAIVQRLRQLEAAGATVH